MRRSVPYLLEPAEWLVRHYEIECNFETADDFGLELKPLKPNLHGLRLVSTHDGRLLRKEWTKNGQVVQSLRFQYGRGNEVTLQRLEKGKWKTLTEYGW